MQYCKVFLIAVHACIFSEQIPRSPSSSFRNAVQYTVYEEMLKEMRERGGQPLEGGRPAGRGEGGGINPCLWAVKAAYILPCTSNMRMVRVIVVLHIIACAF